MVQGIQSAAVSADRVRRVRIFYLLAHLSERRERLVQEIVRPHNLSVTQWRVLYALGKLATRTMNEVADYLVVDRTNLTRSVDKLVARGLLLRVEVAHDRRLTELVLTATGKSLREELLEQNIEVCEQLVEDLSQAQLDGAGEVLEAILTRLVGHRAGAKRITDLV